MIVSIRVAKFGGTSLKDAHRIQQAAKVVQDTESNLVVVSAMSGVTNSLHSLANRAISDSLESCIREMENIGQRHILIASDLHCDFNQEEQIKELVDEAKILITGMNLLGEVSLRSKDRLLSIGERLSSILILAALLKNGTDAIKVEACKVIKTDTAFGRAEPHLDEIKACAEKYMIPSLASGKVVVTQGFIGATTEGTPTTLGRGGSDYSAALLAEALGAEQLGIWTDVPGILRTDPRVIAESQVVPEITFDEAAELATFGAKVLHPATLCPAIRCNIPVFVGSTMQPERGGTWIRSEVEEYPVIRGIAVRREQILLTAKSFKMFHAHGFLANFFSVLANHRISVDLVTTSEVSVAITINNPASLTGDVIHELNQIAQIEIEEDLALVALVGNKMTSTPGIAEKVLSIIRDYNIRFMCHGASDRNFCFLVYEKELQKIVKQLNEQFLEISQKIGAK